MANYHPLDTRHRANRAITPVRTTASLGPAPVVQLGSRAWKNAGDVVPPTLDTRADARAKQTAAQKAAAEVHAQAPVLWQFRRASSTTTPLRAFFAAQKAFGRSAAGQLVYVFIAVALYFALMKIDMTFHINDFLNGTTTIKSIDGS
jgi:hypothetical protein